MLGQLRSRLFTIPAASLATAVLISTAVVTLVFGYWARWQVWLYRLWGGTVLFIFGARVKVRGRRAERDSFIENLLSVKRQRAGGAVA